MSGHQRGGRQVCCSSQIRSNGMWSKQTLPSALIVCCRKRILTVLQEMLGLAQTPPSLVFLLTEKLLSLIPDDQRRIQTVGCLFLQTMLHSSVAFHPSALLARRSQVAEIISDVREPITGTSQPVDENQSRRQQVQVATCRLFQSFFFHSFIPRCSSWAGCLIHRQSV